MCVKVQCVDWNDEALAATTLQICVVLYSLLNSVFAC